MLTQIIIICGNITFINSNMSENCETKLRNNAWAVITALYLHFIYFYFTCLLVYVFNILSYRIYVWA